MAGKIQEVKDKKELQAQERDQALKTKLEKAIKFKSETIKYQQGKTMERAKKWEERKKVHTEKLKVNLNNLAKQSNKYTKRFGDKLMDEKE